ncbi:U7 snRNA-associated Sm-like protein LSm11 isoform X2 [Haemaphysalis longicornis]
MIEKGREIIEFNETSLNVLTRHGDTLTAAPGTGLAGHNILQGELHQQHTDSRWLEKKPVPRVATVVARMTTTHSVGPLSVLFRAVRDRHRVKVWTRSHTRVRSILTGFVHAFDRHVNLALADVDEVLLLPPPPPPAPLQGPERSSASQAATLPLALRLPAWANDETVEQMDADGCTSAVSSTTVCETDRCSAPPAGGSERQSSPRHSVADIPLERTEASAATPGAPPSDPRPTTCSRRPARSGRRRRGLPLAPRSRHVNQLFVRGDNVVSVALLPV